MMFELEETRMISQHNSSKERSAFEADVSALVKYDLCVEDQALPSHLCQVASFDYLHAYHSRVTWHEASKFCMHAAFCARVCIHVRLQLYLKKEKCNCNWNQRQLGTSLQFQQGLLHNNRQSCQIS